VAVKMLDLWGQEHDQDERAGEAANWRSLAGQAVAAELARLAARRAVVKIEDLREGVPAPGTPVSWVYTERDLGKKCKVKRREATVEGVTRFGVALRAVAGYRVTLSWADLLAGHAHLRDASGAVILGRPHLNTLAAGV
jgi:hypothetical protein